MGTAIALGNFDGVHKAHAKLLENMTAYAACHGLESVVYLFAPHPRTLLCPDSPPALLMTTEMKRRRLREAGADRVFLEARGMEILSLSPEAFVDRILVGELDARYVTAGFNYRFGAGAEGDAALLSKLCRERGIACEILESVEFEGKPLSSTRLRAFLEEGDVARIYRASFAPYTIMGTVTEGKKLGRTLGFPTLNIEIPKELLLPRRGVYISRTRILEKEYESITNIGQNPTVEKACPRAESHLLDFSGEVYGENAEIALLEFIRPEEKFSSVAALREQIRQDKEKARQFFERKDHYAADTY